jgi:hypothetical protein
MAQEDVQEYILADLYDAQAAEIAALKAKLAHYTYKTDPYAPENKHQLDDMAEHIIAQAAEIAALKNELDRLTRGTWSLEIARRSLMTADLRAELAAAKEALREQLARSCDDERADPEGLACPIGANLNLAERRIAAQASEIDQLTRLNAALEDCLKRLGGAPMRLNAEQQP